MSAPATPVDGWRTWPVLVDLGATEPDRNGFDVQLTIVQMPLGDTMVRLCLRKHREPLRRLDIRAFHAMRVRPLLERLPPVGDRAASEWNRAEADRLIAALPADELTWDADAHNDGTSEESADYVDGVNDALDKYARPLAAALRSALLEIARLTAPAPTLEPAEAPSC